MYLPVRRNCFFINHEEKISLKIKNIIVYDNQFNNIVATADEGIMEALSEFLPPPNFTVASYKADILEPITVSLPYGVEFVLPMGQVLGERYTSRMLALFDQDINSNFFMFTTYENSNTIVELIGL